jgi:hypothetical protein
LIKIKCDKPGQPGGTRFRATPRKARPFRASGARLALLRLRGMFLVCSMAKVRRNGRARLTGLEMTAKGHGERVGRAARGLSASRCTSALRPHVAGLIGGS